MLHLPLKLCHSAMVHSQKRKLGVIFFYSEKDQTGGREITRNRDPCYHEYDMINDHGQYLK